MLPDYLEPWTQRLNGTWPEQAGPLPDKQSFERAIKLGAGVGHVSGLAWVMYCRPDGATRKEVEAACGHTQHNRARTWQLAGKTTYTKAKRPDGTTAYFIGPPGSSRGGQSAEPISDQDSPMSVDDGDVPIEPQNIVLYGPRVRARPTPPSISHWNYWIHNSCRKIKMIGKLSRHVSTS